MALKLEQPIDFASTSEPDVLSRYLDPAYAYKFTQGPDAVRNHQDALRDGINCISLAHLALKDLFGRQLPSELHCAELYRDRKLFKRVKDTAEMQRGDLVWFGLDKSHVDPEDIELEYRDSALVNWEVSPVKHVAVYTGLLDASGNPLLLHSTRVEGTNTIWPLDRFAEYPIYRKLYSITRLSLDNQTLLNPVQAPGVLRRHNRAVL